MPDDSDFSCPGQEVILPDNVVLEIFGGHLFISASKLLELCRITGGQSCDQSGHGARGFLEVGSMIPRAEGGDEHGCSIEKDVLDSSAQSLPNDVGIAPLWRR